LEKEALVKGVPIGQALDIDIPPPRPKRKPSNPYPRKTSIGVPTSQVGTKDGKLFTSVSSSDCKQALDLEKEPLPEVDISFLFTKIHLLFLFPHLFFFQVRMSLMPSNFLSET